MPVSVLTDRGAACGTGSRVLGYRRLMGTPTDAALRELLARDTARGWRAFIDGYTPSILAHIERAGISQRDEAMDLYVRVCERLAADDCARLRRHDPARGSLHAWLGAVTRHVVVDWVRSRAGRRRLFKSVRDLSAIDRAVFEAYYWRERAPAELAEGVRDDEGRPLGLPRTFDALERIEQVLTERQRYELLAFASRGRPSISVDDEAADVAGQVADEQPDPEQALRIGQAQAAFRAALADLPAEDAAILSLKFVEGLTHAQIASALGLPQVTAARVRGAVDALRARLKARGLERADGSLDPVSLAGNEAT